MWKNGLKIGGEDRFGKYKLIFDNNTINYQLDSYSIIL